ncbi:MAG TPA: hypothetical protein VHV58_04700 [Pseudolabrys sp.]|nr:hypothetical protein [Pseudolabrys sp.]
MVKSGILAMALVFGLAPNADARDQSGVLHRMSCAMVRYYVTLYSAAAAEQYARSKGASEAEINAARRCLSQVPTHTAQAGR